jgi:hypothetical protein
LSPVAFATGAHSPVSAPTSSSLGRAGQFGRFHDGPFAIFATSSALSFRLSKKARHSASTLCGS